MTLAVGDVFELFPPTVNHKKYCLSLGQDESGFTICIYLNSHNDFEHDLPCDCARFDMIAPSDTGMTVVALSNPSRFDDRRLTLFKAKRLGTISKDLAAEIVAFCKDGKARKFSKAECRFVISRLETIA